jgi:hypothetical protein
MKVGTNTQGGTVFHHIYFFLSTFFKIQRYGHLKMRFYFNAIVTSGSNFTSSRWNQWISRLRRNVSHSSFAIRMQLIWKPRFRTFRWYSFHWVFPIFYGFKIDYYSSFEFFKRFPTEYFFEKYAIRKLRYFSSKFNWKFETKYAGSQCEIDLYDVHPLLKTPESLTSYI